MKTTINILQTTAAGAALLLLASCGGESGDGASSANMKTLDTELPMELAVGTPKDLSDTPNLPAAELVPGFKPDPIKVPEDAVLLSKGKPVTSSDTEEPFEGTLAYITDGDKDGNEGFSVILSDGPQWVQIDLEQEVLVDGVILWHYFKNARIVNAVVVQVSNDPEFASGVTTIFNNDAGNTTGQGAGKDKAFLGTYHGKQIAGKGAKGRYVRLWSNGNSDNRMNEYIEVEVWGRPAAN